MMKKILVPTDFSRPAMAAGDLAVELAPLFNAEVHFFHRVSLPPKWEDYSDEEKTRFPESQQRLKYMKNNFKAIKDRYKESRTKISTTYSGGDMVPTISRYIDEENIFMIVMGSTGAAGLKELVFGSNAQKIVRNAHCAVLVVKQPVKDTNFKNVVFASDFRDEARQPFEEMVAFARRFSAHIHLLHIAAYPRFEVSEKDVERMKSFAKDCKVPYTIHGIGDLEIIEGIEFFVKKNKADLVALAHYGGSPLKRIFTGSVSESLVNRLEIPILVLNTSAVRLTPQKEENTDPADAGPLWTFATLN